MKSFVIAILFLFSLFSSVAQDVKWETLKENGYEINYPADWTLNKTGQMNTSFILFSPQANLEDKFQENINLIVQDISAYDLTLEQYTEASIEQIKNFITDSKIISNENVEGPPPFHKLKYSGRQGEFELMFEQYFWIIDGNAFILTFTCQVADYEKYVAVGHKILDSFKIE